MCTLKNILIFVTDLLKHVNDQLAYSQDKRHHKMGPATANNISMHFLSVNVYLIKLDKLLLYKDT